MNALVKLGAGAFAVGTEAFVIAPLLPTIAQDLGIPVSTAGYAVSAFSLTYAVGSPILATLTGGMDRRRVLIAALGVFALANGVAALAQGFTQLLLARMLLALAAGLYQPAANATAVQLVPPEQRGRAVAVVTGGVTVAVALGAPLGAWIGHLAGWRTTFALLGLLSLAVTVALSSGLPRTLTGPVTTLGERLAAMRRGDVLALLATTILWSAGGFAVYTFIAPFLGAVAGFNAAAIDLTVFVFGVAAAAGIALGGWATDRFGPDRTVRAVLSTMLGAMLVIAVIGETMTGWSAGAALLVCLIVWGLSGWAFNPAQALRLIARGPHLASITLSLNASALQLGSGLGALAGSALLERMPIQHLGWLGAAGLALALLSVAVRLPVVLSQAKRA